MGEVTDVSFDDAKCTKCRGPVQVNVQFKGDAISYVTVEPCPTCKGIFFGASERKTARACLNQLIGYFSKDPDHKGMLMWLNKHASKFEDEDED